jgi:hypothetical protein
VGAAQAIDALVDRPFFTQGHGLASRACPALRRAAIERS